MFNIKKLYILILFVLTISFVSADSVCESVNTSQCYYVDNETVSVDWDSCNNISTPCTPETAMGNAQAGDVVYFRGGRYELYASSIPYSGESGYKAILQPSNSGTEENPIIFKAYSGETPVLNGHATIKYSGIADTGTNNTYLVDNDVDFLALDVKNWNIFRTINKDGGASIDSVSEHELIFYTGTHNSNSNLTQGDAYEVSYRFTTTPIGVWRQEYITIDGFKVISDNGVNAARIIMSNHANGFRGKGLVVKNCEIYGGDRNIVHGDNREGVRIEDTNGTVVSNCRVYGFNSMGNNHNTGAFKTYHNDDLLFKNNEIYNSTNGFYIKSLTDGAIIRNNYINNCYEGIIITSYISVAVSSQRNMFIYNNIIAHSKRIAIGDTVQETSDSDNMHIYNNIFYAGSSESASVYVGPGRKNFYNNILFGEPTDYDIGHLRFNSNNPGVGGQLFELVASDHNLFYPDNSSSGLMIKTVNYNDSNERVSTNYWSLLDWQLSGELNDSTNPGNGSFVSNPLFVNNITGNMDSIEDFLLSNNSPAKGAGRDGNDLGADISLVGIVNNNESEIQIYEFVVDTNNNHLIDMDELISIISAWKRDEISIVEVFDYLTKWKKRENV